MTQHRRGLTRVEVLLIVVLALIGLGVFLTFLRYSGETAARAHCQNNLKMLGEGIYYFEGSDSNLKAAGLSLKPRGPAQGTLPAARIADGYATWVVQIAPYLTQQNPLADWDLGKRYAAQPPSARSAIIAELFCPARDRQFRLSRRGDALPGGEHLAGALGDYACAAGDGNPKHDWTGPHANGAIVLGDVLHQEGDGILAWRSRTSFASLVRGRSHTILLGEKHAPPDAFGDAGFGDGSIYNGQHPASFSRIGGPGFGLAPLPAAPFNNNFGSAHSGLCHFLMADLSVRPLSTKVSERVLGELIVRGKE